MGGGRRGGGGGVGRSVGSRVGVGGELGGGVFSNCLANFGPIVAKKVLIKSGVLSGGILVPSSSDSWMSDLAVDLFTRELTSCQNFLGLCLRAASLSCIKAERALRITRFAVVLFSRARGSRWLLPFRSAS